MQYWLDYNEEHFRQTYRERRASEEAKPKFNWDALREIGYADEEIDAMEMKGDK
jgi:hypothetical protein